ncbi:solute carrier family 23 member 1-like [Crassostrea angulata]|uniref:solute carrier family 23 member 1-like n=1 Tax=Magallana angulata TaxID=2784310 RepID=UPI0022B1997B|nr:solute carrier family 23 member 1-like [Crassostrea angulata]
MDASNKSNSFTENLVDQKDMDTKSNRNSSDSQPPTPPPPYVDGFNCKYENNATVINVKEETVKNGSASTDSILAMDNSEKDPMLNEETDAPTLKVERQGLIYKVSESPPVHLLLFFCFQQCLLCLKSSIKSTMLVSEVMCARNHGEFKSLIMSMSLLMSGMCTFLQNTVGFRLPVYQGPIASYVLPLVVLLDVPQYACPDIHTYYNQTIGNVSEVSEVVIKDLYFQEVIIPRFLQMSGALILAGFLHMFVGLTGTVGFLLRFIGPITVIPTILLIGINVYTITYKFCSTHWGVSLFTAGIVLILSLYMDRWNMPIPLWTPKKKIHIIRFPLHQVFSMLIAATVGWTTCVILTNMGVFSDDPNSPEFFARTDTRNDVIHKTPWFIFPYPGMYGTPGFDVGVFSAFLTATIGSILDSIADYYAVARVVRVPSPPVHAMNRGILVEGFMSMMAGFWGAAHGTTTYAGNIGVIGLTKVASRIIFQMLGIMLMVLAVFGKFTSVLITIPYPVVGGLQVIGFGIFLGLVFGNLQYIDMNSTRNLAIIGLSILWGLIIPYWSKLNGDDVIHTGSDHADNFLKMLTRNPNFSGFLIALILDNTVPGTLKERGMLIWQGGNDEDGADQDENLEEGREVYDIPCLTRILKKYRISSYIPFLPTYNPNQTKKAN